MRFLLKRVRAELFEAIGGAAQAAEVRSRGRAARGPSPLRKAQGGGIRNARYRRAGALGSGLLLLGPSGLFRLGRGRGGAVR